MCVITTTDSGIQMNDASAAVGGPVAAEATQKTKPKKPSVSGVKEKCGVTLSVFTGTIASCLCLSFGGLGAKLGFLYLYIQKQVEQNCPFWTLCKHNTTSSQARPS